jgi:YD repeat-containing protein
VTDTSRRGKHLRDCIASFAAFTSFPAGSSSLDAKAAACVRIRNLIGFLTFLFFLSGLAPVAAQSWSNGYARRRSITIDHTKVPNTDQSNFPVLISGTFSYLATTANGGNVTNGNGYDIIFTSDAAGTSTLAFEQESYNGSTGTVNYWVKVPTVSHTTDTVIYLFYGNASITTDQSNKTGVWDSNYVLVSHLSNNAANTTVTDSTSNANNLTNQSNTSSKTAAGAIGAGLTYNGSSDYSSVSNNTSLNIQGSTITLELWVKPTNSTAASSERLLVKEVPSNADPYIRYALWRVNGSSQVAFGVSTGGSGSLTSVTGGSLLAGGWSHIVGIYDGSSIKLFVNGSQASSSSETGNIASSSRPLVIGADTETASEYFNGAVDEARISNSARSADWIATEYNNQSTPSAFYTIGTDASGGPNLTSLSRVSGLFGTSVTITGTNFGSTQGSSTVTFNGTSATVSGWSATSITATVPSGATTGNVVVMVSSISSNGIKLTVTSGYGKRRSITIDHTKVPNTDQSNFPVLISGTYSYLATTSNGGNVTNSNGYDIIFTSDGAGSNVLPFEQESYSASTGAVNYWVQVPTLSHGTDTVIYMFYGNSAITTDQSNKNGTWDSSYKGVWHFNQTPNGTGSELDSTSNGYNGTPASSGISLSSDGIAGASLKFDGVSNSNGVAMSSSTPGGPPVTASLWIKTTGLNSNAQSVIIDKEQWATAGWGIDDNGQYDANVFFRTLPNPNTLVDIPRSNVNNGAWHYLVGTVDSSNHLNFYLDGSLYGTVTPSSVTTNTSGTLSVGGFGGNSGGGLLTEVRVSNLARSADWIATEYNNQNSPSTFYNVASQVDMGGPVITSVSPTTGGAGTSVTITGAGFGASQGTSTVKFNGSAASPTSWSSTSIAAPVPSGATTGSVVVTVLGIPSNPATFTVTGGLSGTVTRQSDGTAINGATVQVLQDRAVIATATTASNGTYSVSSLGTGEYDVKFSASGFGSVLQSAVTVPATGATLNQALATGGTISGKVTQSNGITAISGATVTALQSSETVGTATTDSNGNYSVANLGGGSYEVEVSASAYVNQGLSGVSVTSGNTTTENFSLNALGTQPISYVYDQLGRLTAAIDQAGNVAGYAYDAVGNILSISRGTAQQLSVITFSPNTGSVGRTVTIYGTAFSTSPSQNTVKFNGTTATVTSAAVTSLVVSVPSGATTGTISVTTSAGIATSSSNFTITTAGAGQPTISSFTPSIGTPGTSVSISGTNFDSALANNRVKFNVGPALPSSVTSTTISTSVPSRATSGHLVVTTPNGTVSSSGDFFVPPSGFGASSVGYSNRVSVGGNLTVTISAANTVGLVVFDGTAGHRLSLLTSSNTMTSTGGATTISINNPDGTSLVSQSVTTSTPFIGPQNLSTTGTYTIVVQPSGGATGSITLALYDVSSDVSGSINVDGSAVAVTIASPGQIGTLSFSATASHLLTVHATSNSIGNVTLTLKDPNGNTVTTQNSSSSSFNLTTVALLGTGTYSISVLPNQANTGSITISVTTP